jgi:2-isopropylmalate synthase
VANTLSAINAGARQVECTINGIGERAGNASLEEIVMAIRVRPDRLPYVTGVETREIFASSQLLTALTGEGVQANKAIVGRNAFAHEAGIHQDGMLKDRRTYEIMRPEDVGVSATLVLGKHSGRHAVQRRCEQIGHTLDRATLDAVYKAVIAHADREKVVSDADLTAIVASATGAAPRPEAAPAAIPDFSATPAEVGYGHGV